MSKRDALAAFGDIDDRYLREAETATTVRLPRVLTLVACAAVMAVTIGFAFEQWVMPSITAEAPAHLCVDIRRAEDTDYGLYRRIVERLQYNGRWYQHYDSADFASKGCGRELAEVRYEVDCPFCTPEADGLHDVAGTLFEVKEFDSDFMLCLRRPYGQYELFIAEDKPSYDSGQALFEEEWHLPALAYAVRFERGATASDNRRYILPTNDPVWEPFTEALCNAEVTDDPEINALSSYTVTVYLNNGVSMRLSLTRGGYVEWQSYAFRIDEGVYTAFVDRLAELLQEE